MRNWHRVVVLVVPLLVLLVSASFLKRARDDHQRLVTELTDLRRSTGTSQEVSSEAVDIYEVRYLEYQAVGSEKAFWTFAVVLASFFVLLAMVFVVLERNHSRKRTELIRSFDDDGLQPLPWTEKLDLEFSDPSPEPVEGDSL